VCRPERVPDQFVVAFVGEDGQRVGVPAGGQFVERAAHGFEVRGQLVVGRAEVQRHVRSDDGHPRGGECGGRLLRVAEESGWTQFTAGVTRGRHGRQDRKSTRLNSSHVKISYAVFCLKKKTQTRQQAASTFHT